MFVAKYKKKRNIGFNIVVAYNITDYTIIIIHENRLPTSMRKPLQVGHSNRSVKAVCDDEIRRMINEIRIYRMTQLVL